MFLEGRWSLRNVWSSERKPPSFLMDNDTQNADEASRSPEAMAKALMKALQAMPNIRELVLLGNSLGTRRVDAESPHSAWWTPIIETLSSWGATITFEGFYSNIPAFRVLPILRGCPTLQRVILTNDNVYTEPDPQGRGILHLPKLTHLVGPTSLVQLVAPANSLTSTGLSDYIRPGDGVVAPFSLHTTIPSLRTMRHVVPFWKYYGFHPDVRLTSFEDTIELDERYPRGLIYRVIQWALWPLRSNPTLMQDAQDGLRSGRWP